MPSVALQDWTAVRCAVALDEIENAHRSVGGTGPGRRYATQHLNQAYAVLLAAQFQACCRDLHTECVSFLVRRVAIPTFQARLRAELLWNRKLDRGNPNPGNIGADFARLGVRTSGHNLTSLKRERRKPASFARASGLCPEVLSGSPKLLVGGRGRRRPQSRPQFPAGGVEPLAECHRSPGLQSRGPGREHGTSTGQGPWLARRVQRVGGFL